MKKLKLLSIFIFTIILFISAVSVIYIKKNGHIETNLDEYMPKNHPAFVYSDRAEEDFNIKDGLLFVITSSETIYNSDTLSRIKQLTKELSKTDGIIEVNSLYSAENIIGSDNSLDVKRFYKRVPKNSDKLIELTKNVKKNEMVYGRIVSKDEKSTLVIAEIEEDVFSDRFYENMIALAKKYDGKDRVRIAGRPIVEGTMANLGPKDMKSMVPIVIAIILIVLFMILRSVRNTLLTLLVVLFSTI